MIRRQFLEIAGLTGAAALISLRRESGAAEKHPEEDTKGTETATWVVGGFSCVTCAVGLETMLRQKKGVASAHASYPASSVAIHFHPGLVSKTALQSYMADLGFTAEIREELSAEELKLASR